MPRPRVCLVGGPDIDARLDLMRLLSPEFDFCAAGTDARHAAPFAAAGFPFRHYRMSRRVNPAFDAYTVWQLVRMFRAERPAVVHTFDTKPAVWGRLAARLAGVPVVVATLPGLGSLYGDGGRRSSLTRVVYQRLQTLASHWADLTVFQNADDLGEFAQLGVVPRERAAIVPGSGVRTDVFAPPASRDRTAERRAGLGLPRHGFVVAIVSRVVRSKGVLEFAAAARAVRREEPHTSFLLAGATDADSLDALTPGELRDVADSVTWLGPRNDVKNLLALSDVFVFPSFYREGLPRVLIEAASMALPLVAVDGPGSRDVVEHGVNGLLVPPKDPAAIADAVIRLIHSPELRARFGARARERAVSQFDLSVVAERTRSLYHELLQRKRPEAA